MPKKTPAPTMKRGPEPQRLKIEENWQDAIKQSLQKKKPSEGWPKNA